MKRSMFVLTVVSLGICQAGALAFCPTGYPDEIFCDDFDTYCANGGWPGGAGVQVGTKCSESPLEPITTDGINKLRSVWLPTSETAPSGPPCGVPITLEDDYFEMDVDMQQVTSLPFGGRNSGVTLSLLSQATFRDWVLSPEPPADPVLDLRRFIGNAFTGGCGTCEVVTGTDISPLVLQFVVSTEFYGKICSSTGYIELALGSPDDPLNRANTDYVWGPNCATYCSPAIKQGPHEIMCAQGNPTGPMPAGCPVVETNPPPVHNAVALGLMPMVDPDPCHCGVQQHASISWKPAYFDGRLWWSIMEQNPMPSTRTVTPINGAAMPPPADIPGAATPELQFQLWANPKDYYYGYPIRKTDNWLTLTIKSNTVKIELTTLERSRTTEEDYLIQSVMDNIPRQYLGPFSTIRTGVGPGCELANNNSWTTCRGTDRTCFVNKSNQARDVTFDDLALRGGACYSLAGACCKPDSSCVDCLTESECVAEGGRFQGESSTCETVNCCPYPWADGDHDGDVDQEDFGLFQVCYTGTGGGVPAGCDCMERTGDGNINQDDLIDFKDCYSGANVPWTQAGAPNCEP